MEINGKTLIYGIIGNPVEHSWSPFMHNIAFKHYNLNAVYIPFLVTEQNKENIILSLKTLNIQGVNVTIPYKTVVLSQVDQIDKDAELIKSINTIVFKNGIAKGYSTDYYGFTKELKDLGVKLSELKILVLGNGGAAKAIVKSMILFDGCGENITVAGRNENKLHSFLLETDKRIKTMLLNGEEFISSFSDFDLIINTTPVGMYPDNDKMPINDNVSFNSSQIVYDLIYNPIETKLLQKAKKEGAKTINGLSMLIYQGAKSFELWTGLDFPIEIIKQEFVKKLKGN